MADDNIPQLTESDRFIAAKEAEEAKAKADALAKAQAAYDPEALSDVAKQALAEAEERRKAAKDAVLPKEYGGRDGPEPIRYGDWESKGIASDF